MLTFVYFGMTFTTLYGCYMRITFEGHDEELEARHEARETAMKERRNKKKKR
jgi:hypothetical protein